MKKIKNFKIDLSDMSASKQVRSFIVEGDNDAIFSLEVKNEDGYYYNFDTETFSATKARLDKKRIVNGKYNGSIAFPSIITTDTVNGAVSSGVKVVMDTVVANTMEVGDRVTGNATLNTSSVTVAALNPDGDNTSEFSLSTAVAISDGTTLSFSNDDQYDIYLFAENGHDTFHSEYKEVRFADDSLDLNSSRGSNSSLLQKVIYQYTDTTITLTALSPNNLSGFTATIVTSDTISVSRGQKRAPIPFSIKVAAHTSKAFAIKKQPTINDIAAYVERTIGTAVDIQNEDIYPAVSDTDTVDGIVTSGVKVVMDNNVADNLVVGDKITTAVVTDTVDGAIESGVKVVMDNNVATKMAVGDRITGNKVLDLSEVTVAALDPDGDNVKEFSMSEAVALTDGLTLTFSSKCNRSLTTVAALNPDDDNVKEFSMSQAIALRDNVTLSFSNRENYRWTVTGEGVNKLIPRMRAVGGNVTSGSSISPYEDISTYTTEEVDEFGGKTEITNIVVNGKAPAIDTLVHKPTIANGKITHQLGNVTFNKRQKLALAGDTVKLYAYGPNVIKSLFDSEVELTNLNIALTKPTTTTTEATSAHATIAVADREGVINNTSQVSGIGIDPTVVNPTLTTGGGLDGAGDWIMDAVQTLESGITLTVENTSRVATITGQIALKSVNDASFTLRFDLERLLTTN